MNPSESPSPCSACPRESVRGSNFGLGVRQNLPTPATLPQPPRRSRARRYHPRRRRAAGSLLAYIPRLILARAEGQAGCQRRPAEDAVGQPRQSTFGRFRGGLPGISTGRGFELGSRGSRSTGPATTERIIRERCVETRLLDHGRRHGLTDCGPNLRSQRNRPVGVTQLRFAPIISVANID